MFSYIALAGDPRSTESQLSCERMAQALRYAEQFTAVCDTSALRLFVRGRRPGINDVHAFESARGAIIGKLFRRSKAPTASPAMIGSDVLTGAQDGERLFADLVERHWGRYIAFACEPDGSLSVLRDPAGALPCYRLRHHGVWVVFSWLEDVLQFLPDLAVPPVSWDALGAHLVLGDLAGERTALDGVAAVLPGERVVLHHGAARTSMVWDAAHFARHPLRSAAAESELAACVHHCVQSWSSLYERLVLRLSGGLDSSILAVCLGSPDRVTCLNYFSAGTDTDERRFARLVARHTSQPLIECMRDPTYALSRVLLAARTPTPTPYVGRMQTSQNDAQVAARVGAQCMVTGAGGDQLFYPFTRCWPAADYLRLCGLNAGFVKVAMDSARLGQVSVWDAVKTAMKDSKRRQLPRHQGKARLTLIDQRLFEWATSSSESLHPCVREADDLPIGKLMHLTQITQPVGYYDPHAPEAAPEIVNPLLSQPLIELCLRLPTFTLTSGGISRSLVRSAFAHELPREIWRRRSKGGLEDYLRESINFNKDFITSALLDGELARRGFLNREQVERALCDSNWMSLEPHAAEVHMCVAAECWAKRMLRR